MTMVTSPGSPAIAIIRSRDRRALARWMSRATARPRAVERLAATIVADVRRDGDRALRGHAERLDGFAGPLEVPPKAIDKALVNLPAALRKALERAAAHIHRVARRQRPRGFRVRVAPGVTIVQRVTPLERVGCYVPGGRHPLPSSVLMTAIPARVAGVGEIIVVCPRPDRTVLAASAIAGADRVFRVGGAQAIAALAYGTRSIPRVDKIVGPGNAYVAAAKQLVSADCPIDFFAGPTEIVVVSDAGRPDWIAADLVAQAEHDTAARSVLLTSNPDLARAVQTAVAEQLPREGPAGRALREHGAIVLTRDRQESIALANAIAPEHVACDDAGAAEAITRAGTVFVGPFAVPAAGDYATGGNHVLPTSGAAAFRGGLSTADFVRVNTVQHATRAGLKRLAPTVTALAEAEGLTAHAQSVRLRTGRPTTPARRRPSPMTAAKRSASPRGAHRKSPGQTPRPVGRRG